jgi:hypothetical protein
MTIQWELRSIQRALKAPKNQFNSFGKYNYRSCEDILEAVKPLLPDNYCLAINDDIIQIGNRYYVRATAIFTNGENSISVTAFAREEEDKKGMDGAQVTGAASSYARKYALNGLFLIDDTKDADTQDNTKEVAKKQPEPAKQPSTQQPLPKPVKDAIEQQKEIGVWLTEMYGGIANVEKVLEELTTWTDKANKVVAGKRSVFDLGVKENAKGQSQTSVTHSKVHKMYDEWKKDHDDFTAITEEV